MSTPKDRQRWQPEEDAILSAYAAQYGPNDWNLISERMGQPLDRDPKSCHERWKNYLRPGIKKGPLSEEEQELVIKLQTKYGNKWKRIAAEVPGRTAKRLGKWWEVYKERKLKEKRKYSLEQENGENTISDGFPAFFSSFTAPVIALPQRDVTAFSTSTSPVDNGVCQPPKVQKPVEEQAGNVSGLTTEDETLLTLGPSSSKSEKHCLLEFVATSVPKWMTITSGSSQHRLEPTTESSSNSEVMCFKENVYPVDLLKDFKDCYEAWITQRSKSGQKLKELKQQLELEKREKKRQKVEEVEAKVKALRVEEKLYLEKLEHDYSDLVSNLENDTVTKEQKFIDAWSVKYEQLMRALLNQQQDSTLHGPLFEAIHSGGIDNVA